MLIKKTYLTYIILIWLVFLTNFIQAEISNTSIGVFKCTNKKVSYYISNSKQFTIPQFTSKYLILGRFENACNEFPILTSDVFNSNPNFITLRLGLFTYGTLHYFLGQCTEIKNSQLLSIILNNELKIKSNVVNQAKLVAKNLISNNINHARDQELNFKNDFSIKNNTDEICSIGKSNKKDQIKEIDLTITSSLLQCGSTSVVKN